MPYLLQIHLGPVQEFIAAARRSRDLWFGSWMLSELSKAAARAIAEREGVDALIFPAPKQSTDSDSVADLDPDSPFNVANKIVGVVMAEPRMVAEAAEEAVRRRLSAMRDQTIPPQLRTGLVTWDIAKAQIEDLPEFYWVAVPYDDSTDNPKAFEQARQQADALLAARKNTRSYAQVELRAAGGWGSNRPKSSLDGKRESIVPKKASQMGDLMYRAFRAREREQLSGVDLLKRLGNRSDEERTPFPSTSHMAAMPLRHRLKQLAKDPDMQAAWIAYVKKLKSLDPSIVRQERIHHQQTLPLLVDEKSKPDEESIFLDGALLYEARLRDTLEKEKGLDAARSALQTFLRAADLDKTNKPLTYYALLVGDGDFMGKAIKECGTVKANQAFSQALAGFAAHAKTSIEDHHGALIYAGGDDVLAILPLHTAVTCAAAIASQFRATMNAFSTGIDGQSPTLSVGIAIVHHLEPLEDALEMARAAEKSAKQFSGKNALAVTLAKRSGAPREVVGHWQMSPDTSPNNAGLDTRLLRFAAMQQKQLLPSRLAYQLRTTWLTLGGSSENGEDNQNGSVSAEILKLEAQRLINRKRTAEGQQPLDDETTNFLHEQLDGSATAVDSLATELMIAVEIARACDVAGVEAESPLATSTEEQTTS